MPLCQLNQLTPADVSSSPPHSGKISGLKHMQCACVDLTYATAAVSIVKLRVSGKILMLHMPERIPSPDSESDPGSDDEDSILTSVNPENQGRRSTVIALAQSLSNSDLEVESDPDDGDDDLDGDLGLEPDATDAEDAPDWEFDPDETATPDPEYSFCPAAHRSQILQLLTKHFCRHSAFPDRNNTFHNTAEIRYLCVYEMYFFCKHRGLREVCIFMDWLVPARHVGSLGSLI